MTAGYCVLAEAAAALSSSRVGLRLVTCRGHLDVGRGLEVP